MAGETKRNFIIQPQIKASLWYILSNTLSRAVTLLATPVFTRLLTPAEYAAYPLYVSYMGIFTVLATLELPGTITYSGLSRFSDNEGRGFMLSALLCEALLSTVFMLVYLPLKNTVNSITGMGTVLTLILILQVFLNSAEGLYLSKKRYLGSYKWVTFANGITGIATPLLSILLIIRGMRAGARIISGLSVSVILVSYVAYRLVREGRGLVRREHFKYIFSLALPMLPHYLALSVTAGIDKIMISSLLGEGALGKYSAAFSIGFSVSLIGSGLQMALMPWMVKRAAEKGGTRSVKEALLASQTLLSVATMLFLCAAPEIYRIFTSSAYQESLGVIYPVAIACLFNFSSALCAGVSARLGRARGVTVLTVSTMLVAIILNYILIRNIGYIGAAVASLITSVLRFFLNFRLLSSKEEEKTQNAKYYLRNLAFVILFGVGLFILRSVSVSRILIFFALLLILLSILKKHKKLLFGKT